MMPKGALMSRARRHARLAGGSLLAVAVLFCAAAPAGAVPVFSRKYQTSCQTCHTIFPKLNPFGQAFRLNGYRMPAETEEQVKEKPVSLGSDAQKRMFPDMVYPNSLPGNAPFALNVKMASVWSSTHDDSGTQTIKHDFQFPQEANLFSAGTLGDTFGYFGELTFGENPDGSTEVEIEHARFDIDNAFGPEHLFNFRLGKMAPNLYDGFQEMWIMTDNAIDPIFAYSPIGFNGGTGLGEDGIGLPDRVRGVEMYGVGKHRFFYTVGAAQPIQGGGPNGSFGANDKIDVYGRLDYKFGGMGLDGDTTGVTLPPENWREKSFRVGLFGYTGNGTGVGFDVADPDGNPFKMEDRRYNRFGVFGSAYYGDLNVFSVYLHGSDKLALLDAGTGDLLNETTRNFDSWFLQADYVIKPPFQTSLRYEYLKPADQGVQSQRFLNANFSFLVRANIKAMLEYHVDLRDSKNYLFGAILRFAM
jgi:hypothetical protein